MKKIFALFLCLCLLLTTPVAGMVSAGTSLYERQFENDISTQDWFMTRDISDAYAAGGNVAFTAQSNRSSRLINKTKLYNLEYLGYDFGVEFSARLNITDLPEGRRFGFATGLAFPDEYLQTSNTSFFYLTRTGNKLYVGIHSYSAQGSELVVTEPIQTAAVIGQYFELAVSVSTSGDVSVSVDNVQVYQAQAKQVYFDGYFAIGQDGTCRAIVSNIGIRGFVYQTPENYNALETFDNNMFNAGVWYSESAATSVETFLALTESVLRFKNVTSGFISTRKTYSNAEFCFDLLNLKTQTLFDDDNNIVDSFSAGFSIIFGSDTFRGTDNAAMVEVRIRPTSVNFLHSVPQVFVEIYQDGILMLTVQSNVISELWTATGSAVSFRTIIDDGNFVLQVRKLSDSFYTEVVSLQVPDMSAGYIQFSARGTEGFYANFDVDNMSITNFDYGGKVSYAPYRGNYWQDSDYEYTDSWDDSDLLEGLK